MPDRILKAARDIAVEKGYYCATREAIAQRVGISSTQVYRIAFDSWGGGLEAIRRTLLAAAISAEDLPYLARALQAGVDIGDADLAERVRASHPATSDLLDCPPYAHIWRASYDLVLARGFVATTREAIAEAAGVAKSNVSYAYGSLEEMPAKMIACGIAAGDAKMIARGLQIEHPAAKAAPAALRAEAAAMLAE